MNAKQCEIKTKHPHHEWTVDGVTRWCAGAGKEAR